MTWDEKVSLLERLWGGQGREAFEELMALQEPLFAGPEEFDRAVIEILVMKARRPNAV